MIPTAFKYKIHTNLSIIHMILELWISFIIYLFNIAADRDVKPYWTIIQPHAYYMVMLYSHVLQLL